MGLGLRNRSSKSQIERFSIAPLNRNAELLALSPTSQRFLGSAMGIAIANRKNCCDLGALRPECTKIAHRRLLAIFTADEGIAGNSAARTIFTHFLRRGNCASLAILFAEEIAHLGAPKHRAIFWGAVKIAAAAAENRAILVHSG